MTSPPLTTEPTIPPADQAGNPAGLQLTFGFVAPACQHPGSVLRWHRWGRGGGFHLAAFCTKCGGFICWVPESPEALARAPRRPAA